MSNHHNVGKFVVLIAILLFSFSIFAPANQTYGMQDDPVWELTINAVHQETQIADLFGDKHSPGSGSVFLVVDVTLKNLAFDPSVQLPSPDGPLLGGIGFYTDASAISSGAFSLANIAVRDSNGKKASLAALAIGSDVLIAPNLTDFAVAAPYEEVKYSFIFAVSTGVIDQAFELLFEDMDPIEISLGTSTSVPLASSTPIPTPETPEDTSGEDIGIGVPVSDEDWEVTVNEFQQKTRITSVFQDTYTPGAGKVILVVVVAVHNLKFDPSAKLPDSNTLLSGIHLYEGNSGPKSGKYALSHMFLYDNNQNEYGLIGWGVGVANDFLIAPNLTDFSVASPSEESTYSFAFEMSTTAASLGLEFQFESLPRIRLSAGTSSAPDSTLSQPQSDFDLTNFTQSDVELTETFQLQNYLSFMYPAGWTTLDLGGDPYISLVANTLEPSQPLASGQTVLIVIGPYPSGQYKTSDIIKNMTTATGVSIDQFQALTIGDKSASGLVLPPQPIGDMFAVIFEVSDGSSVMALGATNAGELQQFGPQLMAIIASITYEPPAIDFCQAVVNAGANIRSGPGTNYNIVSRGKAGDEMLVIGQNAAGDWYQLRVEGIESAWISAGLLNTPDCPGGFTLPVVG